MRRVDKASKSSKTSMSNGFAKDHNNNTACKENNGKASRQKLFRSIIILVSSCFVVVSILRLVVNFTQRQNAQNYNHFGNPNDNFALDDYLKRKKKNREMNGMRMRPQDDEEKGNGFGIFGRNRNRGGGREPRGMMGKMGFGGGGDARGMMGRMGWGDLMFAPNRRSLDHRETLPEYARSMTEEELILSATVDMGSISRVMGMGINNEPSSNERLYSRVQGMFCAVDWSSHKTEPAKYPMNRDVIGNSPDCKYAFKYDLATIVQKARLFDKENPDVVRAIKPTGFVFHESRCGSTMIANSLAVSNPSEHRVWSESRGPIEVMLNCQDTINYRDCNKEQTIQLLQDVIYMMGRTNNLEEKRLFFKIQSVGTQHMDILLDAFPDTPWVYLYRDPLHVMMSHLDMPRNFRANCQRHKNSPHVSVRNILDRYGMSEWSASVEEYCAVHLASLDETAYNAYNKHPNGLLLNYNTLPNSLIDTVFPNHFHTPIGEVEKQNILKQSTQYSKQKNPQKGTNFDGDSERKEKRATQGIIDATNKIMLPGYEKLESISTTITANL